MSLEAGRHFIANRAHGALGYSMAAAVGAHFGRPGTKTVAVMGHGSFGQRYFSVDFSRTDHARVAEAFGVKAWRVETPEQLKPSLAAATEHGGPALVDIITQPLHEARAPVSEWVA